MPSKKIMKKNNQLWYLLTLLWFGPIFCSDILFVGDAAFSYPFVYDYLDNLADMRTYACVNTAAHAGFEKYIQQASRDKIVPLIDRHIATLPAKDSMIQWIVKTEQYKPNIGSKESRSEQFRRVDYAGFSMGCTGIDLPVDSRTIVIYKKGDAWLWKALAFQKGRNGDTIGIEVEGDIEFHTYRPLKIRTFDKKHLWTIHDRHNFDRNCVLLIVEKPQKIPWGSISHDFYIGEYYLCAYSADKKQHSSLIPADIPLSEKTMTGQDPLYDYMCYNRLLYIPHGYNMSSATYIAGCAENSATVVTAQVELPIEYSSGQLMLATAVETYEQVVSLHRHDSSKDSLYVLEQIKQAMQHYLPKVPYILRRRADFLILDKPYVVYDFVLQRQMAEHDAQHYRTDYHMETCSWSIQTLLEKLLKHTKPIPVEEVCQIKTAWYDYQFDLIKWSGYQERKILLETCYLMGVYAGISAEHLKDAKDWLAERGVYPIIEEDKSVPGAAAQNSESDVAAVAQSTNQPTQKVILGGYLHAQWHYFSTLLRIPRVMGFLRGLLGFLFRR